MARRQRTQVVLICEDKQHEAFGRRFMKAARLVKHGGDVRAIRASAGMGSAMRTVVNEYVKELATLRKAHVNSVLIVLIDGDSRGVRGRLRDWKMPADRPV